MLRSCRNRDNIEHTIKSKILSVSLESVNELELIINLIQTQARELVKQAIMKCSLARELNLTSAHNRWTMKDRSFLIEQLLFLQHQLYSWSDNFLKRFNFLINKRLTLEEFDSYRKSITATCEFVITEIKVFNEKKLALALGFILENLTWIVDEFSKIVTEYEHLKNKEVVWI